MIYGLFMNLPMVCTKKYHQITKKSMNTHSELGFKWVKDSSTPSWPGAIRKKNINWREKENVTSNNKLPRIV